MKHQSNAGPAAEGIAHQTWVLAQLAAHERHLLRYVRRMVGSEEAARDVVQHSFLQLCDIGQQGVGADARPWLFRVCRNRVIDMRRRNLFQEEHLQSLEHEQAGAYSVFSREPNPAELAERGELCERVWLLAGKLSPAQREVVFLWCEGFSYAEISTITEHAEGYVRVLAHRALQALREHPQVKSWLEEVGVARA